MAIAQDDFHVDLNEQTKTLFLKNQYLQATVSWKSEVSLTSFVIPGNVQDYLWNPGSSVDEVIPGTSLILFRDHPEDSTAALTLPSHWTAGKEILDASNAEVTFTARNDQLSLRKTLLFSIDESVIRLSTEIINNSTAELVFYPAEYTVFNSEMAQTGFPNLNLHLYAPLRDTTDLETAFRYVTQNNQKQQFEVISQQNLIANETDFILSLINKGHYEQVITDSDQEAWVVLQDKNPGRMITVDYQYASEKIQDVSDDLAILVGGAGKRFVNGEEKFFGFEADKYLKVRKILGKVSLKPGETFSYRTTFSTMIMVGPVAKVMDGIVYHNPLDVVTRENGFIVFGVFGIPRTGLIAIEFYDQEDRLLERAFPSLSMNIPGMSGRSPGYVVPHYPAILQHEIWFSLTDGSDPDKDRPGYILSETRRVDAWLTDMKKHNIIKLDQYNAPFRKYDPSTIEGMPNGQNGNTADTKEEN
ncbi:MAG: hypothetical protein ACOX5R_00610 [bacterium]